MGPKSPKTKTQVPRAMRGERERERLKGQEATANEETRGKGVKKEGGDLEIGAKSQERTRAKSQGTEAYESQAPTATSQSQKLFIRGGKREKGKRLELRVSVRVKG